MEDPAKAIELFKAPEGQKVVAIAQFNCVMIVACTESVWIYGPESSVNQMIPKT